MIVKVITISIITVIVVLIIRTERPEIAIITGIAGGIIVLFCLLDYFVEVVGLFEYIGKIANVDAELIGYVLKIVGVGIITEFACDIADDANMKSLSNKISFGGKVVIVCLTIPVVKELIDASVALLSVS